MQLETACVLILRLSQLVERSPNLPDILIDVVFFFFSRLDGKNKTARSSFQVNLPFILLRANK